MNHRDNSLIADRYVALRKATAVQHLTATSNGHRCRALEDTAYSRLIEDQQRRCLSFNKQKTESTAGCSSMETAYSSHMQMLKEKQMNVTLVRQMQASQIVYAPNVDDNFYGQRLDWSSRGIIGIGLDSDCYLYHKMDISKISFGSFYDGKLTSLKFNQQGTLLYLGDSEGELTVFDIDKQVEVRSMQACEGRIGCIENTFEWGLLAGSKDRSIGHHDLRLPKSIVMKLVAHKHEVCGMSFHNGKVASGGNDGTVLLWNIHNAKQFRKHRIHAGAVKAVQWCPWRANLLATGGGSKDHKTILWNADSEQIEQVLEGKSQVTALAWRDSSKDLVTTHGGNVKESYGMIWSSKIKEFTHILSGHRKRILGLAISPLDQSEICTLGADETMRFWKTKRENAPVADPQKKDESFWGISMK